MGFAIGSMAVLADVLTAVVVILGWQSSARGYPWLDTVSGLGISAMILYLAFGVFRNVVPVLKEMTSVARRAPVYA